MTTPQPGIGDWYRLNGGALFEKDSGYCVAGPCAGRALTKVALEVRSGFVVLADGVDVSALAAALTDAAP